MAPARRQRICREGIWGGAERWVNRLARTGDPGVLTGRAAIHYPLAGWLAFTEYISGMLPSYFVR